MGKPFAVEGCTFAWKTPGASAQIVCDTPASQKVKADGKGIYKGTLQFTVSKYRDEKITDENGVPQGAVTIDGTSEACTSEGDAVVLEGDESAQITFIGTSGSSSATSQNILYISSGGQNKVEGV